jgi:hypothetical protein
MNQTTSVPVEFVRLSGLPALLPLFSWEVWWTVDEFFSASWPDGPNYFGGSISGQPDSVEVNSAFTGCGWDGVEICSFNVTVSTGSMPPGNYNVILTYQDSSNQVIYQGGFILPFPCGSTACSCPAHASANSAAGGGSVSSAGNVLVS